MSSDPWSVKPSPTLSLAQSGGRSISTPTFTAHSVLLEKDEGPPTGQYPADGGDVLKDLAFERLFYRWQSSNHKTVIGAGAKAVLYALFRSVLRPGDHAVVLGPYWPSYTELVRLCFAEPTIVQTNPANDYELDLDAIADAVKSKPNRTSLLILSNPNNPSGRVYARSSLRALARLSDELGVVLVIDESFSEVINRRADWDRDSEEPGANVAIVNSFSKNFHLQGLRLAAALVPDAIQDQVIAAHQTVNGAISSSSAWILERLATQHLLKPIDLSKPYRLTCDRLRSMGLTFHDPGGTFYTFPRLSDAVRTRRKLEERGLLALDGKLFGTLYRDHLRFCFAKPLDELAHTLDQLEACL
ncbi:MAG: pyridoxal phosphate-dependent aminotransferase [Pseudomonadota bacterium]